jgi:hypothetical protein
MERVRLYKITWSPKWVQMALGTVYVLEFNKNDAIELAYDVESDRGIIGREAYPEAKAKEVPLTREALRKIKQTESYRGCIVFDGVGDILW